jgi:hypothetical protein
MLRVLVRKRQKRKIIRKKNNQKQNISTLHLVRHAACAGAISKTLATH